LKHIPKTSQDHFHFTFPQFYDILKKVQIVFIKTCKNPKSFHVDIAVIHRVHSVFPSMFPLVHLKLRTRFSVPFTSLKQAHRTEDADGTLVVTSWLEQNRKIFSELIFEPWAHVCGDGEVKHPNFSENFTNSKGKFACSESWHIPRFVWDRQSPGKWRWNYVGTWQFGDNFSDCFLFYNISLHKGI
jgi:hypothetical protein